MRLLTYRDLDLRRVNPAFAKVRAAIEAGDFKSPDVKKLHVANAGLTRRRSRSLYVSSLIGRGADG